MKKKLFAIALITAGFSFQACNSTSSEAESKVIEEAQKKTADSSLNSSLNDLNADLADSTETMAQKK